MRIARRQFLLVFTAFFFVLLSGCSEAGLMENLAPKDDEAAARRYIEMLRQRDFEHIQRDMDASLDDEDPIGTLTEMAKLFPSQEPISVKVVGAQSFENAGSRTIDITLEYEFPGSWLLANVATTTTEGTRKIVGFHVQQSGDSIEHLNRFTLLGKTGEEYFVFLLGVLALAASLYAFIACLRMKIGPKKWLFAVMTLIGIGQLSVNWTTGQLGFALVSIHLPPGGGFKPFYGPWTLYVSIPLGAILFMIFRERLRQGAVQADRRPESMQVPR